MRLLLFILLISLNIHAREIVIGAKKFTEGNISAYILAQTIKEIAPNQKVRVLENLGGTGIVNTAIMNGEIDLYVDYTGTLVQILKTNYEDLEIVMKEKGIELGPLMGFNNSYGLAVKKTSAINSISEITSKLKIGISHEFLERTDGYRALRKDYGLQNNPKVIEHSLLYRSLESGSLDIIEIYTTDAKVQKFGLKTLKDNQQFFPRYDAVIVVNKKFKEKNPILIKKLYRKLSNEFNNQQITDANYLVEIEGWNYQKAASKLTGYTSELKSNYSHSILPSLYEHIEYLLITVFLCILIGVPLGVITTKSKFAERFLLSLISIFQTIPSLALLVFLIPVFGLGKITTIIALVIYGLLPIVKNTHTGIKKIPRELIEYAELIGMGSWQKSFLIEIPLAKEEIISGIKLTAIYTIGITVIAAFIGAGGLGTLIVTGLSLDNHELILRGAIPSALLALMVEFIFQKIIPMFIKKRS